MNKVSVASMGHGPMTPGVNDYCEEKQRRRRVANSETHPRTPLQCSSYCYKRAPGPPYNAGDVCKVACITSPTCVGGRFTSKLGRPRAMPRGLWNYTSF